MNDISVNPMAVVAGTLAEQIATFDEVDADYYGLTITACAQAGWEQALAAVQQGRAKLRYLCHGVEARADDPQAWARDVALIDAAVDFAAEAGAPIVYFTTGRQGRLLWEDAADRVAEYLRPLVASAAERGVRLTLENTLSIRSDLSFTHSLRETARLATMVDAGLCVDLYCCWQESGLRSTLKENLARVQMLQVSDMKVGDLALPNRRVPGDGDIPLALLLDEVKALGYQGLIDVELIGPEIDREGAHSALRRSTSWVTQHMSREVPET